MFLGIRRFTKLTNGEIIAMSRKVGLDWENLAALIDIPYSEQEEIRVNYAKYPSFSSKAKRVFELFNESKCFDRHILIKHFEELRRQDLIKEIPPLEDEVIHEFIYSVVIQSERTRRDRLICHDVLSHRCNVFCRNHLFTEYFMTAVLRTEANES